MSRGSKALCLAGIVLGSIAAGVVNGVLGTGGGIILVFVLRRALKSSIKSSRDVFITTMAAILPISIISLFTYSSAVLDKGPYMLSVMLPAAVGGVIGAVLSRRVKPRVLEIIFGALVIYAGIKMVL